MPLYAAPKVFLRDGYDGAKADAWSFSIILFVLATGRKPFWDDDLRTMYHTICCGDFR
jgi:serine/threonine protein kinase